MTVQRKRSKLQLTKDVFLDMSTGVDGKSFDSGRIMFMICVLFYIGITIYAMRKGDYRFDPLNFASGLGVLFSSAGVLLYAKAGTEPSIGYAVKTDKIAFSQNTDSRHSPDCNQDNSDDNQPDDSDSTTPSTTDTASTTITTKMPLKN